MPRIKILLDAADWPMRAEAAAALGAAGDESVMPDSASTLQHRVQSTREAAAAALAEIAGQAALAALWEQFDRSASERIGYVASALARFGALAVGTLNEVAAHPNPGRSYWAAVALGATGDPGVDDVLERLLDDGATTSFGRQVRVAAKQALRTSQRLQAPRPGAARDLADRAFKAVSRRPAVVVSVVVSFATNRACSSTPAGRLRRSSRLLATMAGQQVSDLESVRVSVLSAYDMCRCRDQRVDRSAVHLGPCRRCCRQAAQPDSSVSVKPAAGIVSVRRDM